jgi:hypothetical protein
MMIRTLGKYKLVLAVAPRAGVGTVDNIIRVLMQVDNPRRWMAGAHATFPADYLKIQFTRNPYARLISQYVWHASANPERTKQSFVEFIDDMKHYRVPTDDHYTPQWGCGRLADFTRVKIEDFARFVQMLNVHGGHQYKVCDFRAGNYKPKTKTDQKVFDWPYRKIFDEFNQDGVQLQVRKEMLGEVYYLGVDYGCNLPTYSAFYNDQVKELATGVIVDDLRHLGYSFEEMKEVSRGTDL